MLYSRVLGKTLREVPAEATITSHKLLVKAGYIDQLMAGVFSFLPLGWRVHQKIENIIREEMNGIGGQEVFLPSLQKKEQWLETGRWETIDPPLFKFKDRHDRELALGPTHEEVITDLARRFIKSYRDLPLAVFQIQNKFRNEMRSSGGLLRVREFVMKDLYSFHKNEADLTRYFEEVRKAYKRIFTRAGVPFVVSLASGGTIGGKTTYEFQAPCLIGEDKVFRCSHCGFAFNAEVKSPDSANKCSKCGQGEMEPLATIEIGHIFALGTDYSQKMKAFYTDEKGKQEPLWMGCYGIGLGRLMATIVETNNDEKGIIWPKEVAPFSAELIAIETAKEKAKKIYQKLLEVGQEILYDDRDDVSPGVKFNDADLLGIPVRLVVSEKTKSKIEWKERKSEKVELLNLKEVISRLTTKNS